MGIYQPTYVGKDGQRRKSKIWWIEYMVDGVRQRRSLHVRDKKVARIIESEIMRNLELAKSGIPSFESTAKADPAPLLEEYETELKRLGRSRTHIQRTAQRIRVLLEGVDRLGDLTPARIRKGLQRVRDDGRSARTLNYYRVALHGFFAWLIQEGRWGTNPVAAVKRAQTGDPKRERRALSDDEFERLLRTAPAERRVVYLTAASTGLRRGELEALKPSDLDLEAGTITVRASASKNHKEVVLPLNPVTRDELRTWMASRNGAKKVFDATPTMQTYRSDLERAKVPYETDEGVADFHALRVTYATSLARSGVSPAMAQKLLRHSDPKLTLNIYTRLKLEEAQAAVARLPLPKDL